MNPMQPYLQPGSPYQMAYGMQPPIGRAPAAPFWGAQGGGQGMQPRQPLYRPGRTPQIEMPTLLHEGPPPMPGADTNQARPMAPAPYTPQPRGQSPRPAAGLGTGYRSRPYLQGPSSLGGAY